jgi:hypothetical protein
MHRHHQERDNHVIHNSRVRGRRTFNRNVPHLRPAPQWYQLSQWHQTPHLRPAQQWQARHVPIGFAAFESPIISLLDYEFFTFVGFRVAILRTTSNDDINEMLKKIYYYGPQSIGYVRVYDTLVPAALGPGDRMILANAPDL